MHDAYSTLLSRALFRRADQHAHFAPCLPDSELQDGDSQRGQAMTEYLIILALIAVAAIAVYQSFGQVIRSQTAGLARELAGESATQAVSAAKAASADALKQKQTKTLKSYGSGAR